MTWTLVFVLAAGAYCFKLVGYLALGQRQLPAPVERCLALIPAALITALIVKDTFTTGQQIHLDARVLGVGAAVIAVRRRAPFAVVIVIAAGVTAAVRAVAG
jgi:branched-subunit amino acid transport protein